MGKPVKPSQEHLLAVRLPMKLIDKLHAESDKTGIKIKKIVQAAVENYLKKLQEKTYD